MAKGISDVEHTQGVIVHDAIDLFHSLTFLTRWSPKCSKGEMFGNFADQFKLLWLNSYSRDSVAYFEYVELLHGCLCCE